MRQRNLILFVVFTFIIMMGWARLGEYLYPRPRRVLLPYPPLWSALPSQLQAVAAGTNPTVGGAAAVATQVAIASWSAEKQEAPVAAAKPEPPKPQAPALVEKPLPKQPPVKREEIALGSDSGDSRFNAQVVLTTWGAGVRMLVLNKFPEADRFGRPAAPPRPMTLIPRTTDEPSNLMYHYDRPDAPDRPRGLLGESEWKLVSKKNGPNDPVHEAVLQMRLPALDVTITKTYTLEPGTYHIGLSIALERSKSRKDPLPFRYQLGGAHNIPIEGLWYTTTYRNAFIGMVDNHGAIWRSFEPSQQVGFQQGGNEVRKTEDKLVRYAGVGNQYFASVIVVDDQQPPNTPQDFIAWARATVEGQHNVERPFLDDITARMVSELLTLKPGVPIVHKYLLYNGPVKVRLLGHMDGAKAIDRKLVERYETGLGLYSLTDMGRMGWWSDLLIACTNLMHGLLYYLHGYIMPFSYGLCIILLTLIVRGTMFPVSRRQALASAKMQAKMAELQPEFKKLEEKYKNDPTRLRQEKMELQLKRGVNPLAMMGSCWMMLAQLPIFLGLYYALQESIHFRLAPFLWIKNLAAPDMLIWWTEKIPFISEPQNLGSPIYLGPYFNLLPVIAVAFMWIQQKVMTPPPTDEQQEMQQKVMKWMTVFMGVMFYKVAAGLCLYFIASSAWGLAERKLFLPKPQAPGIAPATGDGRAEGPKKARKTRPVKQDGDGTGKKIKDLWEQVLKEARKK
jgi:YidC/Oxa1 family membrane protein insertase